MLSATLRLLSNLLIPLVLLSPSSAYLFAGCALDLTEAKKQDLVIYLRAKYELPDSVKLSLTQAEPLKNSCYTAVDVVVTGKTGSQSTKLFLSPDGRYLASDLFDTTVDPAGELRRNRAAIMKGLTAKAVPSLGHSNAPVTVVLFSDFQCPFCRKLAEILDEALPSLSDQVRVVFHHFPLSNHSWALPAAEGSSCAQLQSSHAFWAMHNQLFRNQATITTANVGEKLTQFAKQVPDLNIIEFQRCIDNQLSLGLVFQDQNLAATYEVTSTPTLFINGRKIPGIRDAEHFRELVQEALTQVSKDSSELDFIHLPEG